VAGLHVVVVVPVVVVLVGPAVVVVVGGQVPLQDRLIVRAGEMNGIQ
jgi:hypothetical protein